MKKCGGATGAVYGLGFLGAAFYVVQHANSFQNGLIGILKSIIWPAILTYNLFGFLKM